MISPEQQQLDEALTAAGHADNCPAFEGGACAGLPICAGEPIPGIPEAAHATTLRTQSRVTPLRAAAPVPESLTIALTGRQARAWLRWQEASARLKLAAEAHEQAAKEHQAAHRELAEAAVES